MGDDERGEEWAGRCGDEKLKLKVGIVANMSGIRRQFYFSFRGEGIEYKRVDFYFLVACRSNQMGLIDLTGLNFDC